MALELELTVTVNLRLETDTGVIDDDTIRDAITKMHPSNYDLGKRFNVTGVPDDISWIDDDNAVFTSDCTHYEVTEWKVIDVQ